MENQFGARITKGKDKGPIIRGLRNEMLGVYSLPTTILFDNMGNKVETIVGVLDFSDENLINKFLKY